MMFVHVLGVCRGVRRASLVYLCTYFVLQGHFVFDNIHDVNVQNILYIPT
jgi:hypothetical protein